MIDNHFIHSLEIKSGYSFVNIKIQWASLINIILQTHSVGPNKSPVIDLLIKEPLEYYFDTVEPHHMTICQYQHIAFMLTFPWPMKRTLLSHFHFNSRMVKQ